MDEKERMDQPGGSGITICAKAGQLLDDMQFFDITGNGSLGAGETGILQQLQQLFLGLHIGGGDDLHNLCLSLRFQSPSPLTS